MSRRASFRLMPTVYAATLLTASAVILPAQEVRVFSNTAGGTVVAGGGRLPISDEAVTAIVAQHFAETLHSADPNRITIVVDANGEYVRGSANKAMIVARTSADFAAAGVRVDTISSGGAVTIRRTEAGNSAASGGSAAGVATFVRTENGAVSASGVLGRGVSPDAIANVGAKTYAAGEMGDAAITVTVIKLK